MQVDLITIQDLQLLRQQILEDIKRITQQNKTERKNWLKSSEVRKMLKISPGTLQNLRINGQLSPSKIGGTFYYQLSEIETLLQK